MRTLVFGGRGYLDWPHLFSVLDHQGVTCVIEGGATGADTGAAFWAFCRGIPYETHIADWARYGRKAGPRRNQRMLTFGHPEQAIAFPGGPGTADMLKRALAVGIPILEIAK